MRGRALGHIRGNAIAYLALFVALSGSAYAAKKVGTKQLKRSAVTAPKLAPNAVDSSKIRNGSVQAGDLTGALASAALESGPRSARIVTVCKRDTPVTVTSTGSLGTLPGFTGCSWNQPPGALDFFFGRLKATRPASCADPGEELHVRIDMNVLNTVAMSERTFSGSANAKTFTLAFNDDFAWVTPNWFASATLTPPWTLIPRAFDNCSSNWTIDRFEVVVVRASG